MQFLLNLQPEEIVLEPMDIDEISRMASEFFQKNTPFADANDSVPQPLCFCKSALNFVHFQNLHLLFSANIKRPQTYNNHAIILLKFLKQGRF